MSSNTYLPSILVTTPHREPTGTPIRASLHSHPCPRCRNLVTCGSACATTPGPMPLGVPLTCRSCRLRPTDAPPHAARAGALSSILDNVVDILRAFGWTRAELVAALDGVRDRVKRGG